MRITDALVFQSLKGVGNRTLVSLIKFYQANNLNEIRELDFTKVPKLSSSIAQTVKELLTNGAYDALSLDCEKDLSNWNEAGIHVLVYGSAEYPTQLYSLADPPALLFCKGNYDLIKYPRSIAVVGTRNNTWLGEKIAYKTAQHFSKDRKSVV